MPDDNIIPFPKPQHDKAESAAQFDRQWTPPHKGRDLTGATVDLGKDGRWVVGDPINISRERWQENENRRYRQALNSLSTQTFEQEIRRATVHLDTRPRWRRGWPGWWKLHGSRIQFRALVMLAFAAFAYICVCVTAGPSPLAWSWPDWLFICACLAVGVGFLGAQQR